MQTFSVVGGGVTYAHFTYTQSSFEAQGKTSLFCQMLDINRDRDSEHVTSTRG